MAAIPCTGPISRREFLRLGMLALGGLGLSDLLAARAASGQSPADTSVILFWMWGGPSQLETYDLKPDAPDEYRGPFRPIRTSRAGPGHLRALPAPGRSSATGSPWSARCTTRCRRTTTARSRC